MNVRTVLTRRWRQAAAVAVAVASLATFVVARATAAACGGGPFATAGVPAPVEGAGAWAIDLRTGCEWAWGDAARAVPAASTGKVAVLSTVLQHVAAGRLALADVDERIRAMVAWSDNDSATQLWRLVGGSAAVSAQLRALGLRQFAPWSTFGGLGLSAHDLAWLVRRTVGPSSSLPPALRAYARDRMGEVVAGQRFGVGAAVPPGWRVALKNGWWQIRPVDRGVAGRWRVHSAGMVSTADGTPRWILAVMGDQWPSMKSGIATIEAVSRATARALS